MKKNALIIAIIAGSLLSFNLSHAQTFDTTAIRDAIQRLKTTYPQSTLQDVYKTFYQDQFGPEHLITDTASVRRYLMRELAEYDQDNNPYYEPTGSEGRFVRIYLSAITDSLMTAEQLLDAFIRSASMVEESPVSWAMKWAFIVETVTQSNILFDGFESDVARLREASLIKAAIRHSNAYNAAYHPHYRIVARSIFEKEIKPLLEGNR